VTLPPHPDQLAYAQLLILRRNPIEPMDVAADEVLDPVKAAETRTALPGLYQPGPYHFQRRVHRDRAGVTQPRPISAVVAPQRL